MVATWPGLTWMAGALVALAACSGGSTPALRPMDATGMAPIDAGPCNGVTCDGAIPATMDAGADRGQSPTADASVPADRQENPGGSMDAGTGEPPAACGACAAYGEPALLGRVESPSLNALSGMAVSW